MEWLRNLVSGLRGNPERMLGQGQARSAAEDMLRRDYILYAREMQSLGQPVLPPQEWMQMMEKTRGGYGQGGYGTAQ